MSQKTHPRVHSLSILFLAMFAIALVGCGPEDTRQQDCPEGCLSSSGGPLKCGADDYDCCEVGDPTCDDGSDTDSSRSISVKYLNSTSRSVPTKVTVSKSGATYTLFSTMLAASQEWSKSGAVTEYPGTVITYHFTVMDPTEITHSYSYTVGKSSTYCNFTYRDVTTWDPTRGEYVFVGSTVNGYCD